METHYLRLMCASVLIGTCINFTNSAILSSTYTPTQGIDCKTPANNMATTKPANSFSSTIRQMVAAKTFRSTLASTIRMEGGLTLSSTSYSTHATNPATLPSSSTTASSLPASTFPTTTPSTSILLSTLKSTTALRTSPGKTSLALSTTSQMFSSTRYSTKATTPSTSSSTSTQYITPTPPLTLSTRISTTATTTPTTPTITQNPTTPEAITIRTTFNPTIPTTLSTRHTPRTTKTLTTKTPTTPSTSTIRTTPTTPTTPTTKDPTTPPTTTIRTPPTTTKPPTTLTTASTLNTKSTTPTTLSSTASTASTTQPISRASTAFTAARESSLESSADPVLMVDDMNTDLNDHYSLTSDEFTAPLAGLYYNMICAGHFPNDRLIVRTKGSTPQLGLIRQHTVHSTSDSQCRSGISQLSQGSVVSLVSEGLALYSDDDHQTQWSMFSISDSMSDPYAFSAYRTQSFSTANANVPFTENLDEASAFDAATGQYTCPVNGIYLFSITIGLGAGDTLRLQVTSSVSSRSLELTRVSTAHTGLDTISRPVLLPCQAGEKIGLKLLNGEITGDSTDMLSSFAGFRYNPQYVTPVAWAAYRSSLWKKIFSGLNPVTYEQVLVNEGGAFSNNLVTIQTAGYYYLAMTSGAQAEFKVNMDLRVNGNKIVDVYRRATYHNGEDTLSKELVLRLNKYDVLKMVSTPSTAIYADQGLQTSFLGMLLYSAK